MTKEEWAATWDTLEIEPPARRTRLNQLGAIEMKTDDEWREHDALAGLVAVDEAEASDELSKPQDAVNG